MPQGEAITKAVCQKHFHNNNNNNNKETSYFFSVSFLIIPQYTKFTITSSELTNNAPKIENLPYHKMATNLIEKKNCNIQ